ncbi:MAG: c-type cytochrome [Sphingobacteriia bacterium]|nr:c-type cytochrome [Sphingobacteriia bacterium]NCC38478.1 c-type cytochrome [Gammaproteobacteria bacterium]
MKTIATTLILLMGGALASWSPQAAETRAPAADWTPAALSATLAAMPEGDAARGQLLHREWMCDSCHGAAGIAPTANWPSLAGQKADYTYKILLDYLAERRNEDRRSELMIALMPMLSDQDMADLAVFYEGLTPSAVDPILRADDTADLAHAAALARKGDRSRLITPCASCHGRHGQGGIHAAPALAGQMPIAFTRTMNAYKSGLRDNDVKASMSQFARKLTDEEIHDLATYYARMD